MALRTTKRCRPTFSTSSLLQLKHIKTPSQSFAKELNGAAPEAICSACSRAMRAIPSCHRNGGRPWTVKWPDWNHVKKWTDTTGNKINKTATFWIVQQGNFHYTIQTSLTSLQKNLLYHVLSVQSLVKQAFTFCDNPKPRHLVFGTEPWRLDSDWYHLRLVLQWVLDPVQHNNMKKNMQPSEGIRDRLKDP